MAYEAPATVVTDEKYTAAAHNIIVGDLLALKAIMANVVQGLKVDTQSFSTSLTTFVAVTGLTATITPTSDTSKILVRAVIPVGGASSRVTGKLTGGNTATYLGTVVGNRHAAAGYVDSNSGGLLSMNLSYLDSPATTSPITYGVSLRTQSTDAFYVNREWTDGDNSEISRSAATIIVMEIIV